MTNGAITHVRLPRRDGFEISQEYPIQPADRAQTLPEKLPEVPADARFQYPRLDGTMSGPGTTLPSNSKIQTGG